MLPEKYKALSDQQAAVRIAKAKEKLGEKVMILGHHYQRDEVIEFADRIGDSLYLSKEAAKSSAEYIVFCGVYFMAETADIVTGDDQVVILPDISAGCPMADMAPIDEVKNAWKDLESLGLTENLIPVTYVNSSAEVKAFCGEHDGYVCTSANAEGILKYIIGEGKRIFFFPDRYLSTNTARKLGVKEIALWEREKVSGGLSEDEIRDAKILAWNGYCPVHARFSCKDIDDLRARYPEIKIIVHPEVPEQVAQKADLMGSTSFIVKQIEDSPNGSVWGIGTEIHLVGRLAKQHPDKKIFLIGTPICMCSMMDRISPQYLLWVLESLVEGKVVNQVKVPEKVKGAALKALNRMYGLS
ncbi:quinolinate synthase [bacterium]|nr:quinolinate synthase [bacterium]